MIKINEEELKKLFIEIKHKNSIAFEKLYNRYNKLVYGIAFSILKSKQDADDIVQIVFTKIYFLDKDKLPTQKETSWLYSLTKNETINFLKKNKNNIDMEYIYDVENTNNEINKIIDQDNYNRLISKLNDKEKEIISLKILSNFSFSEIGKILNIPTGTIKWKYYKSIHTLKILLSNLGMFIVFFISSIVAFRNGVKRLDTQKEEIIDIEDNNLNENEDIKGNIVEDIENTENKLEDRDEQIQDNIIIDVSSQNDIINYIGIGFMGLATLFFIITIIFSIIFAKHQLKRRKKLSK